MTAISMKYKAQKRKVYDDGSVTEWTRWKNSIYYELPHAIQGIEYLERENSNWGFDMTIYKMWKYEFRIVEHNPSLNNQHK